MANDKKKELFDIKKTPKSKQINSEKDEVNACKKIANDNGFMFIKTQENKVIGRKAFSNKNGVGFPDVLLYNNNSVVFHLEFKYGKNKPSKKQNEMHLNMIKNGYKVLVISSVDEFKNLLILIKDKKI